MVREERSLAPIAGANVVVRAAGSEIELGRAVTDADGAYELAPFPEAEVNVVVATEEFAPFMAAKNLMTVGGPEVTVVEAQVPDVPASSLRVRVVDLETGLPIKDVAVHGGSRPGVTTDSDGDATLRGLAAAQQLIEFRRVGLPTTIAHVQTFSKRVTNQTFSFPEKSAVVRGTLKDLKGAPLPNRTITFEAGDFMSGRSIATATTDPTGSFSVSLFDGRWYPKVDAYGDVDTFDVDASKPTQPPRSFLLRVHAEDLCRVVDASGTPVRSAATTTYDSKFRLMNSLAGSTDQTGRPTRGIAGILALIGGVGRGRPSTALLGTRKYEPDPPPPPREVLMRAVSDGAMGDAELPESGPCELKLGAPSELVIRLAEPTGSLSWVSLPNSPLPASRTVYFYESARFRIVPGHHTIEVATNAGIRKKYSFIAGTTPTEIIVGR
ncbi:MAG: carboxypeptidase regulatory-like domain-containing protein [Archangium sp.]|nr:carboxypeptidase regulatory-like domain-containing protein [Archangium sp.]